MASALFHHLHVATLYVGAEKLPFLCIPPSGDGALWSNIQTVHLDDLCPFFPPLLLPYHSPCCSRLICPLPHSTIANTALPNIPCPTSAIALLRSARRGPSWRPGCAAAWKLRRRHSLCVRWRTTCTSSPGGGMELTRPHNKALTLKVTMRE